MGSPAPSAASRIPDLEATGTQPIRLDLQTDREGSRGARQEIASTCCYCGVGCGVLIETDGERVTGVRGDPSHPSNAGRLCSKGLNLARTAASLTGRLLTPELRTERNAERRPVSWDEALDHVADRFVDIIRTHGPDAVAFYLSGQLLTEDYYVFNKISKGLIGTNNVDTNSRLCMSSAVMGYKLAFGADGPSNCYEDMELADCVLFAGTNTAWAHPILFRRLEEARARRAQKWIVVDPRRTDTASQADLHLQIQPGTDVALFNGMLHHLIWEGKTDPAYIAAHTEGFEALKAVLRDYPPQLAADICGIRVEDLRQAADWLADSPASLSLYTMGLNQSSRGTDKNLALIHLHLATGQIGRPGAGPFSLTGQPNAMGGREVGGMATMLAAHRDIANDQHRAEVAQQWGIPFERLSATPGLPAIDLFESIRSGKVKAVYIACTNPAHSMPDLPLVRQALRQAELVVVQDCFANIDTMAYADVALPATTWGEKQGTVTNTERRISRVRPAVPAPGQARDDWRIAIDFGQRLQARLHPDEPDLFAWPDQASLYDEYCRLTAGRDLDISGLSHALLDREGPQFWPYPAGASTGQARRYTDGQFVTASGRAQFFPTAYQPVADATSARYPFHLTTGRLRDQWHGMSRTGRVAQLWQHAPLPELSMHPRDAASRDLRAGALVRVSSRQGAFVMPLAVTEDVPPGTVFAAMHWSGQVLNTSGSNETMGSATCPQSRQPELKHTAVRIQPLEVAWHCTLACHTSDVIALQQKLQPLLSQVDYASFSLAGEQVVVVRAAALKAHPRWLQELVRLADLPAGDDALEYRDERRAIYKRAGWRGDYLEGVVMAGPEAPQCDALIAQLVERSPWQGPHITVFAAPRAGAVADRVVCSCKGVRQSQIEAQWREEPGMAVLQAKLGCGTVCGSCKPELQRLCGAIPVATAS